ncbi:hypothetical protein PMIN06_008896 [Paraphaeosphaeria minitans]|uniref:Uncharacterized protein n=1 Tax=Paraphaeosphaeria minitans TaxID=565426 RepID=A0A9P6GBF9_9PLEO|nr:hypothetical protein PMIN01_09972 [Paraphaeosphaeria minitans]
MVLRQRHRLLGSLHDPRFSRRQSALFFLHHLLSAPRHLLRRIQPLHRREIRIGVGVGVGAIFIISVIAGLCLYRRRQSKAYSRTDMKNSNAYDAGGSTEYPEAKGSIAIPPGYAMVDGGHGEPTEMEGHAISEIDGAVKYMMDGVDPVELP